MPSLPERAGAPLAGAPGPADARRIQRVERGLMLGTTLFMVGLVLAHRYLPMNDAPSHIANAVIGSGLRRGDSFFAAHYHMQAVPLPYWMAALFQMAAHAVLPPLAAYRALVAAYLILLPLAFLRLCRAAGAPASGPGAASGAAPAPEPPDPLYASIAALMGFNWAYHLGEINFILGQPFLLLAYAAFLRLARPGAPPRALVAFLALAVAVYLCHIYALAALLGCLGCNLLLRLCGLRPEGDGEGQGRPPLVRPLQVAALSGAGALFALAAYFVFLQHGTAANRGAPGFDLSPRKAAHLLIDPFDSPLLGGPARGLVLALVLVLVLAPLLWGLRASPAGRAGGASRWQRLRARAEAAGALPLLVPGLALLLLAYAGPAHILAPDGTIKEAEISTRFTLTGALLLFAGLRPPAWTGPGRRLRALLLAALLLLTGVKLRDAYHIHQAFDQRLRVFSAEILARLPAERRVLPLLDVPAATMADYLYHRLGAYVVVERRGYSPHVFAVLGQHALRHRHRGDYRQVDALVVTPAEWDYYDYVLVQSDRAEPAVPGLRERADLVHRAAGFALYQIKRQPAGG